MFKKLILTIGISMLVFTSCSSDNTNKEYNDKLKKYQQQERYRPYVTKEEFIIDRLCKEVRFTCLQESADKSWQDLSVREGLDGFELDEKVMKKFNYIKSIYIMYQNKDKRLKDLNVKYEDLDEDFYDKVLEKRYLIEIEESLEKDFPGFWRDVKKGIRYRWIQRAITKANKYGYKNRHSFQFVDLCARIGLDFDKDPKWHYITKFITMEKATLRGYAGAAARYIDFTIYEKDYTVYGDKITRWSMSNALAHLPRPKRRVPNLGEK